MTPTQRHVLQLVANDNVRLTFSLVGGFIIGSACIVGLMWAMSKADELAEDLDESFQYPTVDPKQKRRDETRESERRCRQVLLQTRRATFDELHALADVKSEAA